MLDVAEYIQFQTLLAKVRVECLKQISDNNLIEKARDRDFKIIRNIDYLRNNVDIKIKERENKC